MKKRLLIAVLVLAVIIVAVIFVILSQKPATRARLTIDEDIVREFDLTSDNIIVENFSSYGADITVEVKDGAARVLSSDCPDKICVHTGYISNITQIAVCMPNRAVLEIVE